MVVLTLLIAESKLEDEQHNMIVNLINRFPHGCPVDQSLQAQNYGKQMTPNIEKLLTTPESKTYSLAIINCYLDDWSHLRRNKFFRRSQ